MINLISNNNKATNRMDVCASDKFIVHMINLISNNNKATNRMDVCASDKIIVHMINLISNNNKATNAPDHPVYMMCIRVACARVCVVGYVFVCIQVLLILHVKCRYFFEERLF